MALVHISCFALLMIVLVLVLVLVGVPYVEVYQPPSFGFARAQATYSHHLSCFGRQYIRLLCIRTA